MDERKLRIRDIFRQSPVNGLESPLTVLAEPEIGA
jgi:hypothetical protein